MIEAAWLYENGPHSDLAETYLAALGNSDPMARFRALDTLHAVNPKSRESALMLVEAAVEAKLWGNARSQIERLGGTGQGGVTPRLQHLAARLAAADSDGEGKHFLHGMTEAVAMTADPTWLCGQCGAVADHWQAVCRTCHTMGRVTWAPPARADLAADPPDEALVIDAAPTGIGGEEENKREDTPPLIVG